jgi:hypothetical protein
VKLARIKDLREVGIPCRSVTLAVNCISISCQKKKKKKNYNSNHGVNNYLTFSMKKKPRKHLVDSNRLHRHGECSVVKFCLLAEPLTKATVLLIANLYVQCDCMQSNILHVKFTWWKPTDIIVMTTVVSWMSLNGNLYYTSF